MQGNFYISRHEVEGFAGFSKPLNIYLASNNTSIVLGINGSGKTSLLKSIYHSVSTCISGIIATNAREIDISQSTVSINQEQSEVTTEFNIGQLGRQEIGYRLLSNGQVQIIGSGVNNIRNHFKHLQSDNDSGILPVLRFFQTEKVLNDSVVQTQKHNKLENRSIGYNGHASKQISIQEVTGFLIDQINIENQAKVDQGDLEFETPVGKYLRETINRFTSTLYGHEVNVRVRQSRYSSGQSLFISKRDLELEFTQLSSGEKYILSLVLELIYRSSILNPRLYDLKEVSGIVLVDEIENHLHPRWQLTILDALEEAFPNFQFIVSTHSPLVASSRRREHLIPLYDFDLVSVENIPDIYSGTSDEVLSKILNSDDRISTFEERRKKINKLINKLDFVSAEKELIKIKKEVNSHPEWITDLERKISFGKA